MKALFIISGCASLVVGVFAFLLVFMMFLHPGGMGAEKLLGPVVGLIGLIFFGAGGVMLYLAIRIRDDEPKPR